MFENPVKDRNSQGTGSRDTTKRETDKGHLPHQILCVLFCSQRREASQEWTNLWLNDT